jgi:hypothetical protein
MPPLGTILMHLIVLGLVFCFAAFPIFGRPRTLAGETITDFGHHVIALGKHMANSRDAPYARGRLQVYHQYVRRDSGRTHLDPLGHAPDASIGEPLLEKHDPTAPQLPITDKPG